MYIYTFPSKNFMFTWCTSLQQNSEYNVANLIRLLITAFLQPIWLLNASAQNE